MGFMGMLLNVHMMYVIARVYEWLLCMLRRSESTLNGTVWFTRIHPCDTFVFENVPTEIHRSNLLKGERRIYERYMGKLYNGYRVFPGGKERPGREADPSPPSSAVGHERVELYLYSPFGPYSLYRASVPVQGWPLPLPLL